MKNKKLIYILLPTVILIWGLIIYRLSNGVESNDLQHSFNKKKSDKRNENVYEKDTVKLIANYRDPFLYKGTSVKQTTRFENASSMKAYSQPTSFVPPAAVEKAVILWPQVEYMGVIENKKANTKIAILHIAGKEYLIKEKDSREGITLTRIEKDSVKVMFSKEIKFIRKKSFETMY
jgi:hypothetical protein